MVGAFLLSWLRWRMSVELAMACPWGHTEIATVPGDSKLQQRGTSLRPAPAHSSERDPNASLQGQLFLCQQLKAPFAALNTCFLLVK